jgi:hypothetical protein
LQSSLLPTAIVTVPGAIPMMVTVPGTISIIVVAGAMPMVNRPRSLISICSRTARGVVRGPHGKRCARGDGKCKNPRFHILMYYPLWTLGLPAACRTSYISCLEQVAAPYATQLPALNAETRRFASCAMRRRGRTIRPSKGQRWNSGRVALFLPDQEPCVDVWKRYPV